MLKSILTQLSKPKYPKRSPIYSKSRPSIHYSFNIGYFTSTVNSTKDSSQINDPNNLSKSYNSRLLNRSIIAIRGPDSGKFLQDIMTIDLNKMDNRHRALYGLFMNPKGRIVTDGFVIKPMLAGQTDDNNEYWVDIQSDRFNNVIDYFRTYSLRKDIEIQDYSDIFTGTCFHSKFINHAKLLIIIVVTIQPEIPVPFKEGHIHDTIQNMMPMFDSEQYPGQKETDTV